MHAVLKTESPDVYQKQQTLIKAQGEFKVKLRNLEKSLLKALNESSGNILDDDKIIGTLETLKSEAADIMAKVQETDVIMEEIGRVSASYNNIGSACSRIYFAIDQLDQIHFLYRFSLKFFLEIFNGVLHHNPNLANVKEPAQRLQVLQSDLFHTVFRRVTRGLLHQDHIPFALRLAQIQVRGTPQDPSEEEQDFLLRGGDSTGSLADSLQGFSAVQSRMVAEMTQIPAFKNMVNHIMANRTMEKFPGPSHGRNERSQMLGRQREHGEGVPEGKLPKTFSLEGFETGPYRRGSGPVCLGGIWR